MEVMQSGSQCSERLGAMNSVIEMLGMAGVSERREIKHLRVLIVNGSLKMIFIQKFQQKFHH